MKISRVLVPSAAILLVLGLSACTSSGSSTPTATASSTGSVIAPVVMEAGDLQGATVELVVGQVLDINTGDLAVDSYSGDVEDPKVAEFVAGRKDDGATFNPGITAKAVGTTSVVLSNTDGGIEDVTFTVDVTTP